MASPFFRLELLVDGGPEQVWARLWDLDRHTASVPLTRVGSDDGALRHGSRFVARTTVGPIGFDDVMVVDGWEPPSLAAITKCGRLLTGTITVELAAEGERTRVVWTQHYGARGVPDRAAALVRPVVAAGYRRSLRAILAP
ncbi:SRPBCC family protein [Luteococcus sanguinis]|uniref:SRPBCC family protein n=1 Tax=Luteococcus sanguinis TaxID=174038 RepID=A0ABW1X3A2_9ACTN